MMKHTEKIILIPGDVAEPSKPVDTILNSLDSEMNRILKSVNLPTEIKLKKYQEILHIYNKLHQQKQEPIIASINSEDYVIRNEEILQGMPETRLRTAKAFLNHIRSNPNINIESNGEIVVDGQKIYGSNIIDLVHDFSRDWKAHQPAIGAPEMAKALKRSNIPLESIGNKARLAYFLQQGDGYLRWNE